MWLVVINVLTIAERQIVTEDEFNDIFGALDEEIDFEDEIDREKVETVKGNAEDWTNNVAYVIMMEFMGIEEFIGCQQ